VPSQRELAAEVGRSERWVSQVERGVQPIERLSVLHGTGPVHTAYESAALARIVSWATPDECAALTRLVRKARRDAFEVGKLHAEHEAGKERESGKG
jgi:transcriptional regulator with XRE-family HTH domain